MSQAAHGDGATGQTMSEAAHSNCGKALSSVHSEPADDPAPVSPDPETSGGETGTSSSSGHGPSSSLGNSGSSHGPPPQAHGPKH